MNEEWTKRSLIVPLMEALGWDDPYEVLPEDSPDHVEDSIDYLLKPNRPGASSLCLEAKPLLSAPPQDCDHEQIKKGLAQTKQRSSAYFIWTNGRTWQVFALALPNAEIYEVDIGAANDDETGELAGFLGAQGDGLAFTENATASVTAVLRSIGLRPGDEVLCSRHAYLGVKNALRHYCDEAGADAAGGGGAFSLRRR